MKYKHFCQPHILATKSFSPHVIPETKGLEESLGMSISDANFYFKDDLDFLIHTNFSQSQHSFQQRLDLSDNSTQIIKLYNRFEHVTLERGFSQSALIYLNPSL